MLNFIFAACAKDIPPRMIAFRVDLDKINYARIFTGKTGRRYLSFIRTDRPDEWGNNGEVIHSLSREERAAGGKGEIVGSWRHLSVTKTRSQARPTGGNDNLFNSPAQAFDAAERSEKNSVLDAHNKPCFRPTMAVGAPRRTG